MDETTYLSRLNRYVRDHSAGITSHENTGPGGPLIDVHFFRVLMHPDFDAHVFVRLFREWLHHGEGAFGSMPDEDRVKGGPSYIEWGGYLGDQTLALLFMACGEAANLWTVVTPATLGITGEQAAELAGMGMVMTGGLTWPEGNVIA